MVKKAPRRTAERILETTLELFNRFGEPNVSTTLISAELGMKHYAHAYPHTDIVLLEPDHRDPELYLANTFSYAQRRQLAEHAYQQTRALLLAQQSRLSKQLLRHGITLNLPILHDHTRQLIAPSPPASRWGQALGTLEGVMEDLSQVVHHKTLLRH